MAGSNNFTGQNIQDTYQRVLQLSSSLQLADGTGSLVSFLPISTSYAFTSSVEVTKEISSSHANNADTASYVTAANIVQPFIAITASGHISASGPGAHDLGYVRIQNGTITLDRNGQSYPLSSTDGILSIGHQSATFGTKFNNSITASIISASGHIESERIINPTVAGKSGTNSNAILKVDASSGAYHSRIDFAKGGTVQWVLGSDSTGTGGSNNFRLTGGTDLNTAQGLFITSSNYNVGIGTITNINSKLTVNGDITTTTNITASGNISASGNIGIDGGNGSDFLVGDLEVVSSNAAAPTEIRFAEAAGITAIEIGKGNAHTKNISLFVNFVDSVCSFSRYLFLISFIQ